MTSWQEANSIANMVTAQARRALQVPKGPPQIDVCAAIRRAGVALMWQPLPTIFGAYINEPHSRPGILINSNLPPAARRFTAAHELGHHWMQHTTSVDDDSTVDIFDEVPSRGGRTWPPQEKAAEAFAAWFLMPLSTVRGALEILNLKRPGSALDCYRLSLLLGTPYQTTVRHLQHLRLASAARAAGWAAVPPGRLKASIDRGTTSPARRNPDVWLFDAGFADSDLELRVGDRIVIAGAGTGEADPPPWLIPIGDTTADAAGGSGAAFEAVRTCQDRHLLAVPTQGWSISLRCPTSPVGIDKESSW